MGKVFSWPAASLEAREREVSIKIESSVEHFLTGETKAILKHVKHKQTHTYNPP